MQPARSRLTDTEELASLRLRRIPSVWPLSHPLRLQSSLVTRVGFESDTIDPCAGRHEESYCFKGAHFTARFCAGGQRFAESGTWSFAEGDSTRGSADSSGSDQCLPPYWTDGTWHETVAFIDMARGTGEPKPDLEDAVESLRAAIALQNAQ